MSNAKLGALLVHDKERHLILAVRGDKCLALHIDDGMSRTWLACSSYDGAFIIPNAPGWLNAQRVAAEQRAAAMVRSDGTDAALREAQRAGVWDALTRVASALQREEGP